MKLLRLNLQNFQKIRAADYSFGGKSVSVYGANASGKTTLYNAVTWLLFGNASTGAKNFTPKTRGKNGELHHLDHSAEATFAAEDGQIVTLKKVFHEVWTKKRGSATEEFSGHTVDFYTDGVPCKEKEYAEFIERLFGNADLLKMLTMPDCFPSRMEWSARRKVLMEICGEMSDADIINSKAELADLRDFLRVPGTDDQFRTVDEYKKIASAQKSAINKRLDDIPGRIDEANRAMPTITMANAEEAQLKIDELNAERDRLLSERAAISGTASADARRKLTEEETTMAAEKAALEKEQFEINASVDAKIAAVNRKHTDLTYAVKDAERDLERKSKDLSAVKSMREELVKEYKAAFSATWDEHRAVCPTCHRELPAEKAEELREAFNADKSRRLEEINRRGKEEASKEKVAELEAQAAAAEAALDHAKRDVKIAEVEAAAYEDKRPLRIKYEETKAYAEHTARLAVLKAEVDNSAGTVSAALFEINMKLNTASNALKTAQNDLSAFTLINTQSARIAELEAEEKRLAAEYEQIERGIYLCEMFTRAKVSAITERINEKFTTVRFRLFSEQINGGLKEDCEVLIPADDGTPVPYTDANNAAKINAGLEIIGVLSRHYEKRMPVFVDNAESVTDLAQTGTQTIRLVVSRQDKVLRLEADA